MKTENVGTDEIFLDEKDKIDANSESKMAKQLDTCYFCRKGVYRIHKPNGRPAWKRLNNGRYAHGHCYRDWKRHYKVWERLSKH